MTFLKHDRLFLFLPIRNKGLDSDLTVAHFRLGCWHLRASIVHKPWSDWALGRAAFRVNAYSICVDNGIGIKSYAYAKLIPSTLSMLETKVYHCTLLVGASRLFRRCKRSRLPFLLPQASRMRMVSSHFMWLADSTRPFRSFGIYSSRIPTRHLRVRRLSRLCTMPESLPKQT
jgi:hypothetical protein